MLWRKVCLGWSFFLIAWVTTLMAGTMETQEWKGNASLEAKERYVVIHTLQEWTSLWRETLGKEAPFVDFTHHDAACVFLGYEADWLYLIHFDEGVVQEEKFVIRYVLQPLVLELASPFHGKGQYKMKLYPKGEREVVIQKGGEW